MGSKTMQVKGTGSQSFPAPYYIAPQCGAGDGFSRGLYFTDEVVTGVYNLQVFAFVKEPIGVIADPYRFLR